MWKNICLIVLVLLILLILLYRHLLATYFSSYDTCLRHCIRYVSPGNDFMNYGLWLTEGDTLERANLRLIEFVWQKTEVAKRKNRILDVGCGYGRQDYEWAKHLDTSSESLLTAVDLSHEQIYYALDHYRCDGVEFDIGDAMCLDKRYKPDSFDVILSLESAFHYSDRPRFFSNVHRLLGKDSVFVITDIVLNDHVQRTFGLSLFLKVFSDFLRIPKANHLSARQWEKQLEAAGLQVIEHIDLTDKTFAPYYRFFMQTFAAEQGLPTSVGDSLISFFTRYQPFSYRLAVCKKRGPC